AYTLWAPHTTKSCVLLFAAASSPNSCSILNHHSPIADTKLFLLLYLYIILAVDPPKESRGQRT
ncbi:hypothetical protein ACJX0J_039949, partial [Zea mays]